MKGVIKKVERKMIGVLGIMIVGMLMGSIYASETNLVKEKASWKQDLQDAKDGTRTSHAPIIINSDAEYTTLIMELGDTISNLEIDASGAGVGIYIGNVSMGVIIERCTIAGASGTTGIAIYNSPNAIVRNNTINNGDYGIYIENSGNAVISNNVIQNTNVCGIYIKNTGNVNLDYNKVTSCNSGVSITGSDNANVEYNEIKNNNVVGLQVSNSNNLNIENNTITGNKDGIIINVGSNNVITNNEITNNANYGINIDNANSNVITDNHITGNKIGIRITKSDMNVVEDNESLDNTQYDIYTDTTTNQLKNNNAKKVYTPKKTENKSPGFEFVFIAIAIGLITIYIERRKI